MRILTATALVLACLVALADKPAADAAGGVSEAMRIAAAEPELGGDITETAVGDETSGRASIDGYVWSDPRPATTGSAWIETSGEDRSIDGYSLSSGTLETIQ